MASFFLGQSALSFPVQVKGSVLSPAIKVAFVLTGTVTHQIVGSITVPFKLSQHYTISGTIATPVVLKGDVRSTTSGPGAASVTYNNTIDVPFVLSQKAGVGALASGGPGSNKIVTTVKLSQTFTFGGTITAPVSVTGTIGTIGLLRSPALVHFDGTNFIKRTVGTGTGDNDLSGQANFSAAIVFDPELVELGVSCTVVAKDNGSTQRAWRVEWDATSGNATVTVCASANGANRSSRTTAVAIRNRVVLLFTWNSTTLHLYVNGSLSEGAQTDVGTPGAMASSTEPFSFGCHNPSGGGTAPMKGAVYMLAVFHAALSAGDALNIGADCSFTYDLLASSNLKVLWHPDQIASDATHARFYTWNEQKYGLQLVPGFVSGADLPDIIPSDPLAPFTRRNEWDINFADTGIRPQNLTSTYALSTTVPIRRLYSGAATVPNVAAGSNWRRFKNDLTFFVFGLKQTGTNNVVAVRGYGFELLFDRATKTLFANVGVDTSLTNQNTRFTFSVNSAVGFGENASVSIAIRYNASADRVDCFVGPVKLVGTTSATSSFSNGLGLTVSDQMDYIHAVAVPACVPDASIDNIFTAFNGFGYSDEVGQRWRYVPQGHVEGLSQLFEDYTVRFPTDPDPPAVIAPFTIESIPQLSILPPSLNDQDQVGPYWQYVDDPYPVREGETVDDTGTVQTIYGDPLPVIVSVTATVGHQVTAIANAGPTDAGQVISWWEVEYASGNTETVVQIDYNGANDFSTNRNHTDTFTIPLGLDFSDKRIRFVIQAVVDASQIWRSLYVRMPEDDAFDNDPPDTIIIPGPTQPSPPDISDLEIALNQQALILRRQREAQRLTLQISADSRYKLTRPFLDAELTRGVEFELMSVLTDFYRSGTAFRIHRVRQIDVGFLDRLAVEYFGPGNEKLWWAIAYANAIIDPETDMQLGQAIVIPSREAVQQFLARRPLR